MFYFRNTYFINRFVSLLLIVVAAIAATPSRSYATENFCAESLTAHIPARPAAAPTGSQLASRLEHIGDDERESLIRSELLAGNIPNFLRQLRPVTLRGAAGQGEITVCAMPDYLALGSDSDYLLIPMRLETALAVGQRYGFSLPTPKLVDAIYAQSTVHLVPQPLPAGDAMRSTGYYEHHNEMVRAQRERLGSESGLLTAGDKKDVVLTERLWQNPDRVAIYGWHQSNGQPIQPLSTVHGWHYADYSHGIRLISDQVLVNHHVQSLYSALEDPHLATVLSSEGALHRVAELVDRLQQPHSESFARVQPMPEPGRSETRSLH